MLIVGLGNPGKEYENTFHNMGFITVDVLAEKLNRKIDRVECSAATAVTSVGGEKVILAKPLTYMNLSGQAVKSLMTKYNQKEDDVIVIYDDIDIPRFSVRVRARGSAGTHNGMRNIVSSLQSENFKRIRMGIGRNEYDLKDYVLGKIGKEDMKIFVDRAERTAEAIRLFLSDGDFDKLMRECNGIK